MKTINKTHLQCGYEDNCKDKDCLNCKKLRKKYHLSLTLAEQIVIEDFAVIDIEATIADGKEKEIELMQDIMRKLMKKVFREERKEKNRK